MITSTYNVTIKGQEFTVYSDIIRRGTFAKDQNGVEKTLRSSGDLSNINSVKKAIKLMFSI